MVLSDAESVAWKYVPSVTEAMFVSIFSSSAVATLKPSIDTTVPSLLPMPIGKMRTPAADASLATSSGSGVEVFSSGANFVLFRCAGRGRVVWDGLVAHGILVRDFSSWPGVEDCLRVTVGTREENDRFLSSLADVLRESEGS